MVGLEGRLNLSTREIRLPLGPEIKKAGSGSGKLDLSGMKIRPDGLMKELLSLGGIPEEKTHVLDVGSVDFLIADGGIKYDNFALTFDKTFELIFRGTVRFDDELDLFVGVPVRSALLRRFGVRGPVDQYARLLEGARVDIPVVGTRENPKLDLSKVDLRPLIDKAVKGLLKDKGGGLLEGVLKGLGGDANSGRPTQLPKPDGQPDGAKPPATRPAPKKPEDEAADAVKGVLDSLLK